MSSLQDMSNFLFISMTGPKVAQCIQVVSILLHEPKPVLLCLPCVMCFVFILFSFPVATASSWHENDSFIQKIVFVQGFVVQLNL